MATSAYASTSETTNMNRTSRVLLGPCTDQLRDVLRDCIPPRNFPSVIKQLRKNLPRLTQPQMDLILPRTGNYSGDYSDMDISFLYLLLRNICNIQPHSKGWGNSPDATDHSLSASIERIRETRNRVCHSSSLFLSQNHYHAMLVTIKGAVKSIDTHLNNGNKYEKEVDNLRTETMDPEQELYYIEKLRRQMEEDTQTRAMVTELLQNRQDQEVVIECHQEDIRQLRTQQHEAQRQLDSLAENVQTHSNQIAELDIRNQRQGREIIYIRDQLPEKHTMPVEDPDVDRLKQRLVEMVDDIPLTPVQQDSDKLPIEQLFASVVIKEDSKEPRKKKRLKQDGKQQEQKEVKAPGDILTKNGKPVYRVFMLGDAAHGKTTYCMWLLKKWCNAQQTGLRDRSHDEWENSLNQFDYVFYLPLRNVDPSRASVTDMICNDILESDCGLQSTVKHVLSSDTYRCFIIMDGLDEWNPNQSVKDQLRYKDIPNIENISNCVIFTTMRPWMFASVAELVRDNDRVIEILGLDDKGIGDVIEKVLVHYFEMKPGTDEYRTKYKDISSKLKDDTLRSFIHIPLLAVVCVQIWYKGEQVGDSMTSFFISMVNMLIERAHLKHEVRILCKDKTTNTSLPKKLSEKKNIKNYTHILLKLGKLAYEGLLFNQMKLVFQKDDLETEIGERELKFALDVGLVSQKEAPSIITRNVNIHFLHKSVQEFLAAVYTVTKTEQGQSFCEHLSNINVIMELSNVIMFICGLNPSLGSVISQRVVSVADSDDKIRTWRQLICGDKRVAELYKLQISWYKELQHGQTDSGETQTDTPVTHTDSQVAFHVSDIHLDCYSDIHIMRATKEILSYHHDNIRCLYLGSVPTHKEHGITNTELNDFLSRKDKTRSLVGISIKGCNAKNRSVQTICAPTLRYLTLDNVSVQDSSLDKGPILREMSVLTELNLYDINLGDRDLKLTPDMMDISKICIDNVTMTPSRWGRFVRSLIDIDHTFRVTLTGTNIDSESIAFVLSSPRFEVNHDGDHYDISNERKYKLEFVVRSKR